MANDMHQDWRKWPSKYKSEVIAVTIGGVLTLVVGVYLFSDIVNPPYRDPHEFPFSPKEIAWLILTFFPRLLFCWVDPSVVNEYLKASVELIVAAIINGGIVLIAAHFWTRIFCPKCGK